MSNKKQQPVRPGLVTEYSGDRQAGRGGEAYIFIST